MSLCRVLFLAALMLLLPRGAASTPLTLAHQGYLTDAEGEAVTDTVSITFRLWDQSQGGVELWSEIKSVDVVRGAYSTILGGENPIADVLRENSTLWLEMELEGETLTPRQQVVSAPFAVVADTATSLSGGPVSATRVEVGGQEVIDQAGNWSGPAGSVPWSALEGVPSGLEDGDSDTLSGLSCVSGQTARWNGSEWSCAALSRDDFYVRTASSSSGNDVGTTALCDDANDVPVSGGCTTNLCGILRSSGPATSASGFSSWSGGNSIGNSPTPEWTTSGLGGWGCAVSFNPGCASGGTSVDAYVLCQSVP